MHHTFEAAVHDIHETTIQKPVIDWPAVVGVRLILRVIMSVCLKHCVVYG